MTLRMTHPWRTLLPFLALLACGPEQHAPPELVPLSTASFGGIAVHPDLIAVFEVTYSASEAVWIRPDIEALVPEKERRGAQSFREARLLMIAIQTYSANHYYAASDEDETLPAWTTFAFGFNPSPAATVDGVKSHLSYWEHLQSDDRFVIWRGPEGRPEMAEIFLSADIDLDHDLSRFVSDNQSISILSREGALHRCDYKAYSNPNLDRGPHDWGHEFSCAPVADPSQAPLPRVGVCVEDGEPWRSVLDRLEGAKVQQLNELVLLFNCDQIGFDWPACDTTNRRALERPKIDVPTTCSPFDDWDLFSSSTH